MNRSARRSRSRSRTPPVRAKPKKVVNMLDSSAVSAAREVRRKPISERVTGGPPPSSEFRRTEPQEKTGGEERERITCTIEGSGTRRSVFNRVSGGSFAGGGGRFEGNNRSFDGNRSFEGGNRGRFDRFDGNRSFNERRVNVTGDGPRRSFPDRGFFTDRTPKNDDDLRREDEEKPVMKLVDPQEVPRSNRFFTHDDRGGDSNEWRGRDMYDPRKDTGRYERGRFDRGDRRDNNRDFGNGRRYERDDRDRRGGAEAPRGGDRGGWDGFSRQDRGNVNGYTGARFGEKSAADGVWVHDKYLELSDDDEAKKAADDSEGVLVIDSGKTERTVE